MKILKLIILLITFLTSTNYLEAQIEWVNGMEWEFGTRNWLEPNKESTKLTIARDTIINNIQCKILLSEEFNCNMRPMIDFVYFENNKVFCYNQEDSLFQLLYDFNAEIGDTIKIKNWGNYANQSEYTYLKIDAISTIIYSQTELKVFKAQHGQEYDGEVEFSNYYYKIIEGIGCTDNLFYFFDTGYCDGVHVQELRCFSHPEIGTFSENEDSCSLMTSINDLERIRSDVKIFPNPASNTITVKTQMDIQNIEVYNINGLKVYGSKMSNEFQIDNFESGIYTVILKGTNGVTTTKFIKL